MAYSQPGPGEVWQFVQEVRKSARYDDSSRMLGLLNTGNWMFGDTDGPLPHPFGRASTTKTLPTMDAIAEIVEEAKRALSDTVPKHPDYCDAVRNFATWVLGSSPKPKI